MKKECLLLCLAPLSLNLFSAPTNAQVEVDKKALDVLRETIYQYERQRGTILPPPTLATNAVKPRATNAPLPNIQWNPATPPSKVPLTKPAPPKPAATPIIEKPPTTPTAIEPPAPGHETSVAELERLYLDGKITAKQFQKYLKEQEGRPQAAAVPAVTPPPEKAPAALAKPSGKAAPPQPRTPPPAASPDQSAISEVERKMDELIRLKNAREEKATNASATATNSVAAGPKTQRQKLDELLRQLVDGKISDAEYKEKREQILKEPAPKK